MLASGLVLYMEVVYESVGSPQWLGLFPVTKKKAHQLINALMYQKGSFTVSSIQYESSISFIQYFRLVIIYLC